MAALRLSSKRCIIIVSLQIALVLGFLAMHLLFWGGGIVTIPRLLSSNPILRFCPPQTEEEKEAPIPSEMSHRNVSSMPENNLSRLLHRRNGLPPRNIDLFPGPLPHDHVVIVLYVHNRPSYLRLAVQGLSKVQGISETLLIVSHDGFFEEMNAIVDGIRFCRVKPIFSPYSPHIFRDAFPGVSPGDCKDKDDARSLHCTGDPDQYGNHRAPRVVSLKHHWWWMMNTVWDGLRETRQHQGHMLFIEEDHYLFPNAYLNIQALTALKACKCSDCYMANLSPADVNFRGERTQSLIADKVGNVGYAFNRTIWRKIHSFADRFCKFDDYNWDITMWSAVYPEWVATTVYSLRGPRQSARHFGRCGLHQGKKSVQDTCFDEGGQLPPVEQEDLVPNIDPAWNVQHSVIKGYDRGFKGWGGWGDRRDHNLCLDFAAMYHSDTAFH